MKWYVREVSTAMIVTNLPLCFPLILAMSRHVKGHITAVLASRKSDASKGTHNTLPTGKESLDSSHVGSLVV